MLTLKFMRNGDTTTITCARFDYSSFKNAHGSARGEEIDYDHDDVGGIVTAYPAVTSDSEGVEFKVTNIGSKLVGNNCYEVMYASNMEGKTVDRIGPYISTAPAKLVSR